MTTLRSVAFFEPLEPRRFLSAGDIDTSFGDNGVATVDVSDGGDEVAYAALPAPGGKLVLVGRDSTSEELRIARLSANDGSLDTSFGDQGRVRSNLIVRLDNAASASIDPASGRFAVLYTEGSAQSIAVFDADGSPDNGFDGDGVLSVDENTDYTALAFTSSGDLLAGGTMPVPVEDSPTETRSQPFIRRFNPDGSLDSAFAGAGAGTLNIDSGESVVDLVVAPDGRIVVATSSTFFDNDSQEVTFFSDILRYDAAGALDTSFGDNGSVRPVSGFGDYVDIVSFSARDLDVAADGSVALLVKGSGVDDFVYRYTPQGDLIASTLVNAINHIAFDSDGNTVLNGGSWTQRLLPDGGRDRTYGGGDGEFLFGMEEGSVVTIGNDVMLVGGTGVGETPTPTGGDFLLLRLQGGVSPASITLHPTGTLAVTTNDLDETISVAIRGRDHRLVVRVNDFARSFAPSRVKRIAVESFAGDDSITIAPTITRGCFIDAGDGNDVITSSSGNDFLLGGTGKDRIFAGAGDDLCYGGGGNDYILSGPGRDVLFGDAGNDTLSAGGGRDNLTGGAGDNVLRDI